MSGLKARPIAAVAVGNALEFYDFLTYGFFAAQIGRTFFPSTDPNASLLASLATFGAGFLMRPVGAIVIGRVADRAGRKPAMLLSFSLMGLAILALALVPSYASIGRSAAVLVILCRLAQGFALGGEVGPSTAYLVEAAPAHRRGLYVAFQYTGQQAAVMAAGVVGFGLASVLPDKALDAWGWRVAFLLGLAIVPFGVILRNRLAETLMAEPEASEPAPLTPALARQVLLAIVLFAGGTTATYLGNYMTTYATSTLHMPKTIGFAATITVGLCGMLGSIVAGLLSDRFGRKPVMLIPWTFLMLALIPMFSVVAATRSGAALLGASAVLSFCNVISSATVLAAMTEALPRRIRGRSLGFTYAFAISVFGGSTQFTVAWLTGLTHSPLAPAIYATTAVAISLAFMLCVRETAPSRVKTAAALVG